MKLSDLQPEEREILLNEAKEQILTEYHAFHEAKENTLATELAYAVSRNTQQQYSPSPKPVHNASINMPENAVTTL